MNLHSNLIHRYWNSFSNLYLALSFQLKTGEASPILILLKLFLLLASPPTSHWLLTNSHMHPKVKLVDERWIDFLCIYFVNIPLHASWIYQRVFTFLTKSYPIRFISHGIHWKFPLNRPDTCTCHTRAREKRTSQDEIPSWTKQKREDECVMG